MNAHLCTLVSLLTIGAALQTAQGDGGSAPAVPARPGPPPGTYTITPAADEIRIPFEMFNGDIRLHGQVNGQDARMLIDNGALWDQLLFFGSPRVDALGLETVDKIAVSGAGSGDVVEAGVAKDIYLTFEGLDGMAIDFEGQEGVITPYDPALPNPWAGAEGQVSSVLFKNFVVGFDFDHGIMTLTRPEAFASEGKGKVLPITPVANAAWTIPGAITLHDGRRLELNMTMDLGWNEPLGINTGQAHGITVPPGLTKTALGYGAQGPIYGYWGTVPSLELAGITFGEVEATYSTLEDGGAKVDEVMVGMGIFTRFHVIFDYPGHRVFLRPNAKVDLPFRRHAPKSAEKSDKDRAG